MNVKILTLFPEMFEGPLSTSIINRAIENNILNIEYVNIRDFSKNKHKKVDDYPYGGGNGMVMTPQPIFDSHQYALEKLKSEEKCRTIYLSPKGIVFNQELALELSNEKQIIFICGHYEGVDQRVIDSIVTDEISIGDYVLTGGEIPTIVIIDAITRLIPGVLADENSYKDESIHSGLLEYPQYTRPHIYNDLEVPSILLSGDHKKIEQWRREQSLKITYERRKDLIQRANLSLKDKKYLIELNI